MEACKFFKKYCLHDGVIDEIIYEPRTKELIWHMDFAFWMQDDYAEGTPENGMVNLHFHQVKGYSGIIGKVDWFSVDHIVANPDSTITCTVLNDYNDRYYEWTFCVADMEIEDLHIDSTNEDSM